MYNFNLEKKPVILENIKSLLIFLSVSDIITNFPQTLNKIIKFIEN